MQSLKRFILASVITAFIIVAFGVIPAWAVTLTQKQGANLWSDGDTLSGEYGQLIGGEDSNGAFQSLSVGTDGVLDVDVASSVALDTELPAATALSDNQANPTAPAVGAFLMGHDGTTWDRLGVIAILDDRSTTLFDAGLVSNGVMFAFDPVDGNYDRVRTAAGTADSGILAFQLEDASNGRSLALLNTAADDSANGVSSLAYTFAYNTLYDPIDDNWDRQQTVGADTGRAQVSDVTAPSANSPVRFAVSGTSACSTDLTNNSEYVLAVESGTDSTIHCCHGDAGDCTADQNDQPYFGENHYRIWIHTTNERVCCVSGNAGTATATLDLQTAP